MGKLKQKHKKPLKSHLTPDEVKQGKMSLYILIGMIIVGAAVGLYYIQ